MNATVVQVRQLRDGRQLTQIARCPYCEADHWLLAEGTLAHAPCGTNRVVLLDGIGAPLQ
jgi:hypothetical protein